MRSPLVMSVTAAAVVLAMAPAWGQELEFDFSEMAAKAKDKVEIDLSGSLLEQMLAAKPEKAEMLKNLTRVMVRTFEFEQAGAYQDSDLDPLRRQLGAGSGWSKLIDAKEDGEHSEIYVRNQDGKLAGFVIIAAEQTELTVIEIGGALEFQQLASVQELVQSSIQYDLKEIGARR